MKFLHTADWHLGRSLYGRRRYDEFEAFLNWLAETIEREQVDALLLAGDVFDTNLPGNRAQQLYYRFLARVSSSCCRHVVVIAGNHDSASFLNAPRELLLALNVHVVGACTGDPADELILLKHNDTLEAVICAVPYLRDKDIRKAEAGENYEDKERKLLLGIQQHYEEIAALGEQARGSSPCPLIAMGHLFTSGGQTVDGDGVRDLYVGSLAHVGAEAFPSSIDYLALGHLHVPQTVGGCEHLRYSGSPIPMGFGEAGQQKQVLLVEFNPAAESPSPLITAVNVPCFQELVRLSGSWDSLMSELSMLKMAGSRAWLEIEYTGTDILPNLRELIEEETEGTAMEVLRIKNRQVIDRVLRQESDNESLEELSTDDVFTRCLDAHEVPEEQRAELLYSYRTIVEKVELEMTDENS